MNQYQWTFLDNQRRRHTLGVAHGQTTGHLVVHCDHRVVLIEFSVLDEQEFSFFVEDELCILKILGDSDAGFTYDFQIDTEVDTEVNRVRNAGLAKKRRTNLWQSIAFFLAPVLILGSLFMWGYTSYINSLPDQLAAGGIRAHGRLLESGQLEFIAGREVYKSNPMATDPARIEALDLEVLDSIPIIFLDQNPKHFIVDWRRAITPLSTDKYRSTSFAEALFTVLRKDLPLLAGKPVCALRTATRMSGQKGLVGLIDSYLLDDKVDREQWELRFLEPAYQARLEKICEAEVGLPSDRSN